MNVPARHPPLPENSRVYFTGAPVSARLLEASARAAARLEGSEFLRPYLDRDDPDPLGARGPGRVVIDFPPAFDRAAGERAGEAWRRFREAGGRLPRSGAAAELRIALAKLERCFVARPVSGRLRWQAVPAGTLPGRGLWVLARDDEFVAAAAGSRWCERWRRAGPGRSSLAAVQSFPLPWSPWTLRSALTREQEERRDAVIRAWRSGDDEEIDGQVAAAYGWRASVDDAEAHERLRVLHAARSVPRATAGA